MKINLPQMAVVVGVVLGVLTPYVAILRAQENTDRQPISVRSVAWSPDGSHIAVGKATASCEPDANLYTIQIIDAVTRQVVQTLVGSTCDVTSIDWSPDGSALAASSLDGIGTRVWDVQSGQLLMEAQEGGQGINTVKWRPPNGLQLADAAVSGGIGILDPTTGETESLAPIGGMSLDWSPDGSKLVSGHSSENLVYVADMVAGQQIMALAGHMAPTNTVDWSPDGTRLASGGGLEDPTIWVWDAVTGQNLLILQGHTVAVSEVRWRPNSSQLASAGDDGTVRVWDGATGETIEIFDYPGRVYTVDWSPDGDRLAYGGYRSDGQDAEVEIVELSSSNTHPTLTPAR